MDHLLAGDVVRPAARTSEGLSEYLVEAILCHRISDGSVTRTRVILPETLDTREGTTRRGAAGLLKKSPAARVSARAEARIQDLW